MNWDKAKNYTIVFLLFLNILLLLLNIWERKSNILTASQKSDIIQVLKNNDIQLDCDIPDKFPPMTSLSMEMYEFDYLKMQKVFFGNIKDVVRTDYEGQVVFKKADNYLTLLNNTFSYTGRADYKSSFSEARNLADKYIGDMADVFGNYSFYRAEETDEGYYFEYMERYNRNNIFVNYIQIYIYENTIAINGQYYKLKESTGSVSAIISADEALFSAIPILNEYYDTGCTITNIELGYYYNNTINNKEITAAPAYKITVSDNTVYYINGYSGAVE